MCYNTVLQFVVQWLWNRLRPLYSLVVLSVMRCVVNH